MQWFCPACGSQLPVNGKTRVVPPIGISTPNSPRTPSNSIYWRKPIVFSLAAITAASLFVPGGMIWSISTWFAKGHSLCVWNGCFKQTEKTVQYGNIQESSSVGYCNEHFKSAPKSLTSARHGKSFSGLLTAIFGLGPVVFALWYFLLATKAILHEPNALAYFVGASVTAILPMNALSYFYWIHVEWMLRAQGL